MPILVRPVREQLEHDRIIRLLEAKWRRKFKVEANPGDERNAGVKVPAGTFYPDLVLTEEGGRKPKALIEVETSESVNHLEAMAQWAHLAKARTSLVLFVPAGAVESARRLASDNSIRVAELWTYLVLGDQVRFTSVFRENGTEPADLVEKVEVFTTERAAPQPRPVPVEAAPEPVEAPAAPERPRKLAVKVASRAPGEPAPIKPKAGAAPPATAAKAAAANAKPEPAKAVAAVTAKPAPPKAAEKVEKKVAPPKPAVARPVPAKPAVAKVAKPAPKAAKKPAAPAKAAKKASPKPAAKPAKVPAKAAKKPAAAKSARPSKRK